MTQTLEKVKGIEVLKEACAACGEAIAVRKGRMIVKDEARVVSTHSFKIVCWRVLCPHCISQEEFLPQSLVSSACSGAPSICWGPGVRDGLFKGFMLGLLALYRAAMETTWY